MKNKKIIFISIISAVLLFSAFYVLYLYIDFSLCKKAAVQLQDYNHEELLRIKVYGSSETEDGDTISGTFSIIDSKGSEIAVIERSWNGLYLSVDFSQITFGNKQFDFPLKIYAKKSLMQKSLQRKIGTTLEKYYNENGLCILAGSGESKKTEKYLYRLSRFALRKNILFGFSHKKTLTIDLSGCINGKYYSVIRVNSGNLLLKEL